MEKQNIRTLVMMDTMSAVTPVMDLMYKNDPRLEGIRNEINFSMDIVAILELQKKRFEEVRLSILN